MATLGDLERAVMNVLWESDAELSANALRDRLVELPADDSGPGGSDRREIATTTMLTVLSRLESKGFVTRSRDRRPHLYRAVTSRADHTAELMHEVLGASPDREAALARFVGSVSPTEAETLRKLLASRG
ncbi:BlaI/MecI/CopY family transcriptional regulator [Compostimonas suwonensis]|uniref:Putative transcriptional regulator n=1 Tax=Compostimonas suwonensis TaxID=1048394 RepID=A0A2M9BZ73_9MICO|nr:BlaI/MecI/CopY family transcriptional regulator [Compostimonas suwonensis]PJJ63383.1 putative transcriptional regulator [Compostimonas suwonensis]